MPEKLDKFFTPRSLLIINAAIILLSETMGNLFLETGTIHFIAVLFIILAVSRIFIHYYTFDPVLEKFVHANSLALLFFAGSHFMEFLGYKILNLPKDALFANVVNFYLISILFVIIGTELFLRIYYRRSHFLLWLLGIIATILAALTIFFVLNPEHISLESAAAPLWLYTILVLTSSALGFIRLIEIRRRVPLTRNFIRYFIIAFVLVVLAALQNLYYELLEDIGLPVSQIIYVSHFTFYAALSLMFIAFSKLSNLNLTGVYQGLKK